MTTTTNNKSNKSTEEQQKIIYELLTDREVSARIVTGLQKRIEQQNRGLEQVTQELKGIKTAVLQNPGNPQLAIQMSTQVYNTQQRNKGKQMRQTMRVKSLKDNRQ